MIDAWTWPAYVGILLGSGLFALTFVPTLIVQSRRYGRVAVGRLLAVGALSIYVTALGYYTVFPFPGDGWCAANVSPPAQLVPFHSLDEIAAATSSLSLAQTVRDVTVLQVAFNVLLFVPFGVLARRLLGLGPAATILAGFAVSLLIETTQGTGAFGIVGCAYRVADVDDLITNTLGAVIGVLAAPLLTRWLPSARSLEAHRRRPRPVTRRRRLLAMLVDLALVFAVSVTLTLVYRAVVFYVLERPLPPATDWGNQAVPSIVAAFVVIVPSLIGSGASWGQRALWLTPSTDGNRFRRAVRPLTGIGAYAILSALAVLPALAERPTGRTFDILSGIVALASVLAVLADRSARGLSFRVWGLDLRDAREEIVTMRTTRLDVSGD